jgi:hypothetical protein
MRTQQCRERALYRLGSAAGWKNLEGKRPKHCPTEVRVHTSGSLYRLRWLGMCDQAARFNKAAFEKTSILQRAQCLLRRGGLPDSARLHGARSRLAVALCVEHTQDDAPWINYDIAGEIALHMGDISTAVRYLRQRREERALLICRFVTRREARARWLPRSVAVRAAVPCHGCQCVRLVQIDREPPSCNY